MVIPCYRGGHHCRWPACSIDCDGRAPTIKGKEHLALPDALYAVAFKRCGLCQEPVGPHSEYYCKDGVACAERFEMRQRK